MRLKTINQTMNQVNRVYDTPFIVEEYTTVKSDSGVQKKRWRFKYKLFAAVKNLYGREYEIARQRNNKKTVKFIIKFGPYITEEMRIIFNGKIFDIDNIDNIGFKNQELEIRAIERAKKSGH